MVGPPIRHYGKVEEGLTLFYNLPLYDRDIDSLEGKEFEVTIQEKHTDVSKDQHAFLGVILTEALKNEVFGGWIRDELRDFLKEKYLAEKIVKEIRGEQVEIKVVPSLANISKKKMSWFIERCLEFMASEGIVIEDPNGKSEKR